MALSYYLEYLEAILEIKSKDDESPQKYFEEFVNYVMGELGEFSNKHHLEEFEYEIHTLDTLSEFNSNDPVEKLTEKYNLLCSFMNELIDMINENTESSLYLEAHADKLINVLI